MRFLSLKELNDGTPVEVVVHPILNTTRIVLTCRNAMEAPEESLLTDLVSQELKAK